MLLNYYYINKTNLIKNTIFYKNTSTLLLHLYAKILTTDICI